MCIFAMQGVDDIVDGRIVADIVHSDGGTDNYTRLGLVNSRGVEALLLPDLIQDSVRGHQSDQIVSLGNIDKHAEQFAVISNHSRTAEARPFRFFADRIGHFQIYLLTILMVERQRFMKLVICSAIHAAFIHTQYSSYYEI